LQDSDVESISKSTTLQEIRLTSPGLSERSLQLLARIKTLSVLWFPSFAGGQQFELEFEAERKRLGFERVQLVPAPAIDDATAKIMFSGMR